MTGRRRVVYTPERVHAMFARMRNEIREMDERRVAELRAMGEKYLAELRALRAELDELRSLSLARQRAELEIAALRRLREIGRARAAERDPAQPLH